MWKQWGHFITKLYFKTFFAFKMAYSCCFSLGGNLDFLDFYNIDYSPGLVINVTRLGDFYKFFLNKFSLKSSPNIQKLFRLLWKTTFMSKLPWLLLGTFWKIKVYFLFQHLVTLLVIVIHVSILYVQGRLAATWRATFLRRLPHLWPLGLDRGPLHGLRQRQGLLTESSGTVANLINILRS